jgi:hypothetical protein
MLLMQSGKIAVLSQFGPIAPTVHYPAESGYALLTINPEEY